MKNLVVATALAVLSGIVVAEESNPAPKKIDRGRLEAAMYKKTGGKIVRPGTLQGEIVYVNCQDVVAEECLLESAESFKMQSRLPIAVKRGVFKFPSPKIVGNASLFVIDDEQLPTILSAPEDRWAMVNVAHLKKGAGQKEAFFAARVKKELTRGFAILAGAQSSNYPNSLTGCITSADQLDEFVNEKLPIDILARFVPYVKGFGVIPGVEVTYLKACQEGWAPNPTNEIQQTIWKQVHEKPSDPIKIKYDPKKGE